MSNKYEQLVEFIINDETDKARELFHKIVVEKSRDIYESLVEEEDLDEVMGGNEVEEMVKDVQMDEEGISEEEEYGEEGEESEEDEDGAFDHDEMGGEEQDVETRVDDLESALDELKAEFDALMAGEEHEEEKFPGIHDGEEGEEMGNEEFYEAEEDEEDSEELDESKEEDDEEDDEEDLEESRIVKEYVDNVGTPYKGELDGKEGKTVGTGNSFKATPNTKDPVASKNDMGGSAKNIATGKANGNPDGNAPAKEGAPNQYKKGEGNLPHAGSFKNVPGSKKVWDGGGEGGHGAEKVGDKDGKLAGNDGRIAQGKKPVISTTPR